MSSPVYRKYELNSIVQIVIRPPIKVCNLEQGPFPTTLPTEDFLDMAFPPELVAFLIAAVVWAVWRVSHNFISRSPLDNIPGPTPPSWIKGTRWNTLKAMRCTNYVLQVILVKFMTGTGGSGSTVSETISTKLSSLQGSMV